MQLGFCYVLLGEQSKTCRNSLFTLFKFFIFNFYRDNADKTFVSYTNIFLAAKILKNELLHNVEEHVKLSLSQRAQYRILQKDPQLSS